jgi:Domain of unknown function (DUF4399)
MRALYLPAPFLPVLAVFSGLVLATPTGSAATDPNAAPAPAAPEHAMSPADKTPHVRRPSPPNAFVYIGWPTDGAVLHTTHVKVWFGTRNFGVAPAGADKPNTGHHHLLVDTNLPEDMNEPIPNDRNHLHFGLGQTETVLELPPGTHTLQLLMGDLDHVPHDPPLYSKKITIRVVVGEKHIAAN